MTKLASSIKVVPLGLNREQSAFHIGVGTTLFDEMVADGRMPRPRVVNSRRVWSRPELELAFEELPVDGEPAAFNPWDKI